MSRFIRTFVVTLATLPSLLLVGSTAAFARTDNPSVDTGVQLPSPASFPEPDTTSFTDRVQWMGAGAGILLALIVVYIAATALVHRHQRIGQLRTS